MPRNTPKNGNPVPAIKNATIAMTQGTCYGLYTFYSASYTIPGGITYNARLDVSSGQYGDFFNLASTLAGTCLPYSGSATCGSVTTPSSTSSSAASSTQAGSSTQVSTSSTAASSTVASTSSTSSPSPTLAIKPQVGGYNFVGCWTEGVGTRALTGAAFAYDGMTLETCMVNCTGFAYWGTEYGRECYCGNKPDPSSSQAALSDCSFSCAGNQYEYCGAGNRLELYSTTATATATATLSTSSTAAPTSTLAVKPTVGKYSFQGCITEGNGIRALSAASTANDGMTLEVCAAYCDSFTYFGTEYGRECKY